MLDWKRIYTNTKPKYLLYSDPGWGDYKQGGRKTVQEPFTETESEATMGNGWVTDGEYYSRQTGWPSAAGAGAAFCL